MIGPFDTLPRRSADLKWTELPGSKGRYDMALSINVEEPKPAVNNPEDLSISLNIRQNLKTHGVATLCEYQVRSLPTGDEYVISTNGPVPSAHDKEAGEFCLSLSVSL